MNGESILILNFLYLSSSSPSTDMAEFKVLELSPLQRIIPPPPRTPARRRQVAAAVKVSTVDRPTHRHRPGVISTVWPRPNPDRWFSVLALLQARQCTGRPILAIVIIVLVVINIFLVQQRQLEAVPAAVAVASAAAVTTEMVWSSASARRSPSWTSSRRPRPTPPSTSSTIGY